MNNEILIVERIYTAPPDMLWKALTDSGQMQQWYFPILAFRPVIGFEFQFEAGSEHKTYLHLCKITEVIPGKKIAYSWKYGGYDGSSEVSFELFDEGEQTRIKLAHAGLDTFPQDKKDFCKESFAEGWNYILGTSLKNFVEGGDEEK